VDRKADVGNAVGIGQFHGDAAARRVRPNSHGRGRNAARSRCDRWPILHIRRRERFIKRLADGPAGRCGNVALASALESLARAGRVFIAIGCGMDIEKTRRNGLEQLQTLMLHPLEQKLVALRSRLRRMTLVYGLCVTAATPLAAIVVLGLVDYYWSFKIAVCVFSFCFRCSVHSVGPSIASSARHWLHPLDDIDLARQIERAFPSLRDRLMSAVEFLRQSEDDPAAGSVRFAARPSRKRLPQAGKMQFADVVDSRPAKRAAMTLAVVGLAAFVFVAISPSISFIAVARLANPFGDDHFMSWTKMKIIEPPTLELVSVRLTPPAIPVGRRERRSVVSAR